jgi:hypothetical protein
MIWIQAILNIIGVSVAMCAHTLCPAELPKLCKMCPMQHINIDLTFKICTKPKLQHSHLRNWTPFYMQDLTPSFKKVPLPNN